MDEDIKILESECYYLEELGYLRENNHFIRFNQALENLIKGYRELEEEVSKIEYVEKETIYNANPEYWDTKGRYTIRYHNRIDVIPKSKIREKIEELFKKLDEPNNDRWEKGDDVYYNQIKAQIRILKELMKDNNEFRGVFENAKTLKPIPNRMGDK
jgi:hypothetical protein